LGSIPPDPGIGYRPGSPPGPVVVYTRSCPEGANPCEASGCGQPPAPERPPGSTRTNNAIGSSDGRRVLPSPLGAV
jgi:hypothetical protein